MHTYMSSNTYAKKVEYRQLYAEKIKSILLWMYESSNKVTIEIIKEWIPYIESNQESFLSGLTSIYTDYIPEDQKIFFRQAIGDVLRQNSMAGLFTRIDPVEDLLYLMANVRATESSEAIVSTIGKSDLGKKFPELIYSSLAALKKLASCGDVSSSVEDFIKTHNFNSAYLFSALEILMSCSPDDAVEILKKYRLAIDAHKKWVESFKSEDENVAYERGIEALKKHGARTLASSCKDAYYKYCDTLRIETPELVNYFAATKSGSYAAPTPRRINRAMENRT